MSSAAAALASSFSPHHNDRDNDGDRNDDDDKVLAYGHAAGPADRRDSVALVTRYFAAAATSSGAAGCRLLVPFIAESLAEEVGPDGEARATRCSAALSRLFARHHSLLTTKHATLHVLDVRVLGNHALTVLDFPTIPEVRQIAERRVGNRWMLLEPLDDIIE